MGHKGDAPHDAAILTLTVEPEEASDGVDEDLRRYNVMLATLGYAPGHYEDGTVGDDATYYGAHTNIATAGMNTNATVFEPMSHDDGRIGSNDDDEAGASMFVAQHEDRRINFVVDSGAQAHNLQYLEAFGLEWPSSSTTGFAFGPRSLRGRPTLGWDRSVQ